MKKQLVLCTALLLVALAAAAAKQSYDPSATREDATAQSAQAVEPDPNYDLDDGAISYSSPPAEWQVNAYHGEDYADEQEPGQRPHTDESAPGYSWPAVDMDKDGVFDRLDRCPNTASGMPVDMCGCAMAEASVDEIHPITSSPPGIGSPYHDDLLRHGVIPLDMAFFEFDRAEILPGAQQALLELSDLIRSYPTLKFEVSGHADSRGTEEYNQDLSERRAAAVRRFLVQVGGVRDVQLVARGYGEMRLSTWERNDDEYQANRRVELKLVNPEAMPRGSKIHASSPMRTLAFQQRRGHPDLMASR